jgi:hypothetical protein
LWIQSRKAKIVFEKCKNVWLKRAILWAEARQFSMKVSEIINCTANFIQIIPISPFTVHIFLFGHQKWGLDLDPDLGHINLIRVRKKP